MPGQAIRAPARSQRFNIDLLSEASTDCPKFSWIFRRASSDLRSSANTRRPGAAPRPFNFFVKSSVLMWQSSLASDAGSGSRTHCVIRSRLVCGFETPLGLQPRFLVRPLLTLHRSHTLFIHRCGRGGGKDSSRDEKGVSGKEEAKKQSGSTNTIPVIPTTPPH